MKMISWLPPLFSVDPWHSDTFDKLYSIFCSDIRDYKLLYQGKRVWTFPEKEDGKEAIFWHLTHRENKPEKIPRRKLKFYKNQEAKKAERLPDLRRCERLPWIKPMIENPMTDEILAWDYQEDNKSINTYIWLKNEKYIIIFKKYGDNTRRLITAYYVDEEHKNKKFSKKYNNRIKIERPAQTAGPTPSALTPKRDG